jgi:voltage-gated potassium channel
LASFRKTHTISTHLTTTYRHALKRFAKALSRSPILYSGILIALLVVVGTIGYNLLEGWSLLDALYATIITITTVGYGDFSPQSMAGRIFAVFFTLIAIGIAGYAVSQAAASLIEREHRRVKRLVQERKMEQIASLKGHIILCGGGYVGKRVAKEFYKANAPFLIVEPKLDLLRWTLLYLQKDYALKKSQAIYDDVLIEDDSAEDLHEEITELAERLGVLYLQQDPTQDATLIRAGIERAKGLVTAFDDDKENLFVVLSARQAARKLDNADLRIVARVVEEENANKLVAAGADKIVSPNAIGGLQLASEMIRPEVASFWNQMLHETEQVLQFTEIDVDQSPEWVGRTVADVREGIGLAVVAIKRNGRYNYMLKPKSVLQSGDLLIVIGARET